jgi:hypothetical protein
MTGGPTVVYLAGSGRSGSTLLERTLGEMPDFVNVGELIDLFRRVAPRNERCGCGQPFTNCPFWSRVGAGAFGGWDAGLLEATHQLQRKVARQRHLPRLLADRRAGKDFRDAVNSYGETYARLYRAIAAQAGASYVVDASKWPVQALALSLAGIDVRVIHLVRDVRGVAHSLAKPDVARPHATAGTDVMWHVRPASAAARWVACQSEADLLRRRGIRVARLRYEDFVRQPRHGITRALGELTIPATASQLAHIADGRVSLGTSHGLSGNPLRFAAGEVTLRVDEGWREEMSRRDRAVVTAIGLPQLIRHRPPVARPAGGRPAYPARAAMTSHGVASGRAPVSDYRKWPLVSVILPTRGRPELVREAIASVVGQTYPGEIECIVVHDQEPPDPDLTRLATARRSVAVVANSRTPGLAGARNTGVAAAHGDYLAGCDDDDVWHLAKLHAQMTRLLDDPGLLAVGSGMRLLLPGGQVASWPGRAELISYRLLLRNRVKELHSSTLVMRREAVTRAGLYDEDLPGGYAEDYDWMLRLARAGQVGTVTEPLADIRKDTWSWYMGGMENTAAGLEYLLAKHPDFAASPRGHARILGQIAFARSVLGQRRLALRYALTALAKWPASPHACVALAHIATGIDPRHFRRAARLLGRGMI